MSKRTVVEIIILLAAIATIVGVVLSIYFDFGPKPPIPNEPTPTSIVALPSPTAFPTTPVPVQPTLVPTVQPTPTETPILQPGTTEPTTVSPGVYPEHITLTSNYSDPIIVTITKIDIQQYNMLWSLTLENTGPDAASVTFRYIYLEEGNQVNNPSSNPPELPASGGLRRII